MILAAGRSTRMGRPKALLEVAPGGPTFVERIAATLRDGGVSEVLVVGRNDDGALRDVVERLAFPVRYVVNARPDEGQLSSIVAGIDAVDHPGLSAVLITLVDLPLIEPRLVEALLDAHAATGSPLVRAVHGARHGHPMVVARRLFDDLRHADPSVGAKAVVRLYASSIVDVEADNDGVLLDVDDPADYDRLISGARLPSQP